MTVHFHATIVYQTSPIGVTIPDPGGVIADIPGDIILNDLLGQGYTLLQSTLVYEPYRTYWIFMLYKPDPKVPGPERPTSPAGGQPQYQPKKPKRKIE